MELTDIFICIFPIYTLSGWILFYPPTKIFHCFEKVSLESELTLKLIWKQKNEVIKYLHHSANMPLDIAIVIVELYLFDEVHKRFVLKTLEKKLRFRSKVLLKLMRTYLMVGIIFEYLICVVIIILQICPNSLEIELMLLIQSWIISILCLYSLWLFMSWINENHISIYGNKGEINAENCYYILLVSHFSVFCAFLSNFFSFVWIVIMVFGVCYVWAITDIDM